MSKPDGQVRPGLWGKAYGATVAWRLTARIEYPVEGLVRWATKSACSH